MLRLSQGQLTLLDYCPRRFQYTILQGLTVTPSPELLVGQQWGDRFHLLMQQREMGLPIDPVLAQDPELQTCLAHLLAQAPTLFDTTGETFRQSEHSRSLVFQGYWFTVVYDLLRLWGDRAEIIDWKTYLNPRNPAYLNHDWQTRLYLYVLTETTCFQPHQVAMTYWFVRAHDPETQAPTPQQAQIPYSLSAHEHTRQDLERLTQQLTQLLEAGEAFPQRPLGHPNCDTCPFSVRCQRGVGQSLDTMDLPVLEDIDEVPI